MDLLDARLGLDDIRKNVNDVVAEQGADHKYSEGEHNGCAYVDYDYEYASEDDDFELIGYSNPRPGCLIGTALIKYGIDMESFVAHDLNISTGADRLPVWSDDNAKYWASAAQQAQDTGETWGRAVEFADWMQTQKQDDYVPLLKVWRDANA